MSEMDKDFTEQELELEAMAAQSAEEAAPKKVKAEKSDKKPKKEKKKVNPVVRWIKELRAELKKVMWPTRKQTINNTAIVIACCAVVGAFIWVFDLAAVNVFGALLRLFN
jgi:preprotein translocase, SecE subunit, bacterial